MLVKILKDKFRPLFYQTFISWHKKYKCKQTERLFYSYKDKHKNESCFIVANGPSLRMDDLDEIMKLGLPTFGVNRIYKIFDTTKWRPTYMAVQDETILMDSCKEIQKECLGIPLFLRSTGYSKYDIDGGIYFNSDISYSNKGIIPPFMDGSNCVFAEGLTIVYTVMQLAVYMGFKNIYLLGCDCSYKTLSHVSSNDYVDKRLATGVKLGMPPAVEYWFKVYSVANEYALKHDLSIYNVTRGGMLEVFERKDLDKLIFELSKK